MEKRTIGLIYSGRKSKDEEVFARVAKKKDVKTVLINIDRIDEKKLEKTAKGCDILYNSSAEEFSVELVKTLEELGKKVVDSSKSFYYIEEKWMFYVKCRKNKIPVPETILLSQNITAAKEELIKFNHWPVVLKGVSGTMGEYVEEAETINRAEKIIKRFWKEDSERLPIIAQEFIKSPSYRVTLIDGKIVQTAIKYNKSGWKATGVYAKKIGRFAVDKNLSEIIKRLMRFVKIKVCGVDLLKKEGKWLVLEVNSDPAFDFFEEEREEIIGKVIDFLKKEITHESHEAS
ncbi:MAG: ATP-grasp domain-containing protein [Nanoarchaeota archaeon]|nr:ATP-grasp domain-containing protein [Nanoarchaeota archaeon]